ncbi:rare lipoprotein A [Dysgonomonas alginatilytica]|uniref:Probable endolytic peptidoglycan transglycosylase RlpA n=1 Tax=Dysgonomonas alginatilytica TaxID=1605892 RepID=A0A2V3PK82_9BACT|nr:septal ring lytic transglycosylase RlpA family protein [Dysgonomonas alginatilytica]PXV61908.1 rare lipoprotein A [Dysgonomonas alginatilytica]
MKSTLTLLLFLSLCASVIKAQIPSKVETGKATYYGKKFNNRKTASGAIYKRDIFVCAHRTYPFGTKLLIKNLKNDKEVIVEVIDRGPFKKGRVVDISYIAAKELDMIHHGVTTVEVSEYIIPDTLNLLEASIQLKTDTIVEPLAN